MINLSFIFDQSSIIMLADVFHCATELNAIASFGRS